LGGRPSTPLTCGPRHPLLALSADRTAAAARLGFAAIKRVVEESPGSRDWRWRL